jgi:hypothetical protein
VASRKLWQGLQLFLQTTAVTWTYSRIAGKVPCTQVNFGDYGVTQDLPNTGYLLSSAPSGLFYAMLQATEETVLLDPLVFRQSPVDAF